MAVWLQNKLEHYKLPSNLNGRTDLPKEIRPIFRDKSELAGGVLADEIQSALEASKYLIVICSPRAAQSQWVGKEVQSFIDMGRTEKIIPFIIGGTAHAQNPEDECFPSALLNLPPEQELLGINIDEMGRDAAAVKVVAQMFGLKFDSLWQRYEREQRRRRVFVIIAALLLALIGIGVAVGFSRQNKRIKEQKKEIERQNDDIQRKNDYLLNDSIVMSAQLDSINRRDALIGLQRDSIVLTNQSLIIERNNLKKTNWDMLASQARFLSEKALHLATEGYVSKAICLCLEILPKDVNRPERPYVAEAEYAFRQICAKDGLTNERIVLKKGKCNSSWRLLRKIDVGIGEVYSATFSSDNKRIVTTSESGLLKIYDIETSSCIYSDSMSYFEDGYAELSPDGKYIGSTGWGSVCLIDIETHKRVYLFEEDDPSMVSGRGYLHFSNDGRFIVTSMVMGDRVFNISNVNKIVEIELFEGWYSGDFVISPDSKDLVVKKHYSDKCDYEVYELSSGRLLKTLNYAFPEDSYACFDSTNRFIYVVDCNRLFVIERESLLCVDTITCDDNSDYFNGSFRNHNVYYNTDGLMKSQIVGGAVEIYRKDRDQGFSIDSTSFLKISTDESLMATVPMDGNSILLWDIKSRQLLFRLPVNDTVIHVDFRPDGKYLVSCSKSNVIRMWNTSTGRCEKLYDFKSFEWASFDATGRFLIAYYTIDGEETGKMQLIDYNADRVSWECIVDEDFFVGPLFEKNDNYVSRNAFEPFIVNLKTGSVIDVPIDVEEAYLVTNHHLVLHPSRPILFVTGRIIGNHGGATVLYIYDFESKDTLGVISANDNRNFSYISDVCVSPDGDFFVTASSTSKQLCLYEMKSFKPLFTITIPKIVEDDLELKIGFLPSNDSFFYECDGCIYIYSIKDGSLIDYVSNIHDCTFSEKGNYIISRDSINTYSILKYRPLKTLLKMVRYKYKDIYFTPEERHRYYLE